MKEGFEEMKVNAQVKKQNINAWMDRLMTSWLENNVKRARKKEKE